MEENMAEAFVYKWYNRKSKMCYIGRHKGSIDDGYIASSPDFLWDYRYSPKSFEREILFVGTWKEVCKREGIEIRNAVEQYGKDKVYNKCQFAKFPKRSIPTMSQQKLYEYKNEIESQINELQEKLKKLREDKSQVVIELKKFSTKKNKKECV